MMTIGFDFISDLNLLPDEELNWEDKATSLYCIIAGNISHDLTVLKQSLSHLSKCYQGVFYIPGSLEFSDKHGTFTKIKQIKEIVDGIKNAVLLHNHVVIVDGIAIVGINGWALEQSNTLTLDKIIHETHRNEDLIYLMSTIDRLQLHGDVKKIIVVSHAVPRTELLFNEVPDIYNDFLPLVIALGKDKEKKVSNWIFGTQTKMVDIDIDGVNYTNNVYLKNTPYWPKRIAIEI